MQLFVNDLTVMDFSYLCPRRGMVGESWIVDVMLDGDLNDESMIQDFGKVKKDLKRLIDEYVDHKLLVPADHAGASITHLDDEQVEVRFPLDDDEIIQLFLKKQPLLGQIRGVLAFLGYIDNLLLGCLGDNLLDTNPKIVLSHHYFAARDEFLVHIHIHTGIGRLVELHY